MKRYTNTSLQSRKKNAELQRNLYKQEKIDKGEIYISKKDKEKIDACAFTNHRLKISKELTAQVYLSLEKQGYDTNDKTFVKCLLVLLRNIINQYIEKGLIEKITLVEAHEYLLDRKEKGINRKYYPYNTGASSLIEEAKEEKKEKIKSMINNT